MNDKITQHGSIEPPTENTDQVPTAQTDLPGPGDEGKNKIDPEMEKQIREEERQRRSYAEQRRRR